MKALIYTGEGSLVFSDAPDPTCAEGEVLVEVHSVGICGSDLHAFHGKDERRPPPLILGHEVKGVSQEIVNLSDQCLEIPQYGTKHSLNVSVCAGIVIWEVFNKYAKNL